MTLRQTAAAAGTSPPASPGDPGEPLLSVSDVAVTFGPVRALDGVSLQIRRGELLAVAGENGAGKTTLVRCVAGDIAPERGEIRLDGQRLASGPGAVGRQGVAVVWQDLALCDNLDVGSNIMLGQETRLLMLSGRRFHARTAALLADLGIPITDTTRNVRQLSGGERQLVAVARAMVRKPTLLVLDEPTAALGVLESRQVEDLIMALHAKGTTILLACHDIDQMFRLADRIVVLRHAQVVAELDPLAAHPDEVVALLSGQSLDVSARRQLTRLHGLAGRLESADPSSSLSLILSALSAALAAPRLCIHVLSGSALTCAASLGFDPGQLDLWARLPAGPAGGTAGLAAASGQPAATTGTGGHPAAVPLPGGVTCAWSVPVRGPSGLSGVITAFPAERRAPQRDELDLLALYAGYAANVVERDRLLDQVTARNRILETIREMLQTLAGPVPVTEGLVTAVQALRRGLRADEVALATWPAEASRATRSTRAGGEAPEIRAYAGPAGTRPARAPGSLVDAARRGLAGRGDGVALPIPNQPGQWSLAVRFPAPAGPSVLVAAWRRAVTGAQEAALLEDAAHSLRLALEREAAAAAHQEAAALRRSRELQRSFLSRLSHELRTPLTAIRGYASSLLATDVTWDAESVHRFLDQIASESARLGRLVGDLLDFSAIEAGTMRLQCDWCDLPMVLKAAVGCLPNDSAGCVTVRCAEDLPAVWADHDRLEQVFVNLLGNAVEHNPAGTQVHVTVRTCDSTSPGETGAAVVVCVADDGVGIPAEVATAPFEPARRLRTHRAVTSGAGLGLSIAAGIIRAHSGSIEVRRRTRGTGVVVRLPVEAPAPGKAHA